MDAILSDFQMKMNREDIVIRFYEDFLTAYKPQMRERRGVYYTPEPVVFYIVRSVDHILKTDFKLSALARTLAMKALAVQTAKSGGAQHSLTNINC